MNILLFKENETHLDKKDARSEHIRKILHLKKGDSFKAGIINGKQGVATIVSDLDGFDLSFAFDKDKSSLYPLTLIVAQVRPICMKRILREAVSLGVERLILPVSDLGEKSYLESALYKDNEYESILLDGAMQSGFTGVSECILAKNVEEAIMLVDSDEKLLLDNVIGAKALSSLDLNGKSVTLAIGPERGWTERERKIFIGNGFSPCLLGSRILRTETASVAASALALSLMSFI